MKELLAELWAWKRAFVITAARLFAPVEYRGVPVAGQMNLRLVGRLVSTAGRYQLLDKVDLVGIINCLLSTEVGCVQPVSLGSRSLGEVEKSLGRR